MSAIIVAHVEKMDFVGSVFDAGHAEGNAFLFRGWGVGGGEVVRVDVVVVHVVVVDVVGHGGCLYKMQATPNPVSVLLTIPGLSGRALNRVAMKINTKVNKKYHDHHHEMS